MHYKSRSGFIRKLALSTVGLSIIGIIGVYLAISTVVESVTYVIVVTIVAGSVVVALLIFTMIFVTWLTRNMEAGDFVEERLRIIIDNMPMVANFRDKDFNILECNEEAAKLFSLSSKEEYIDRFFDLSPIYQPDGRLSKEKSEELISEAFATGYTKFEWMHCKLDGTPIPTEVSLTRIDWRGEEHLMAFARDLRDFYKYKETEHQVKQRMEAMLSASPLACSVFDEELNVLEANDVCLKLFEVKDVAEYSEKFFDLSPKHQPNGSVSREKMYEKFQHCINLERMNFEWMHQTADGETLIPCEVSLERLSIDEKDMVIAYVRDLREINKAMIMVSQLEKAAFSDALTGLRNRRYFLTEAKKLLQKCNKKNEPFSLLMIDIDHFKSVNDTYGHPAGDGVLKIFAARMRHTLRKDTLMARYGGEEFIVAFPETDDEKALVFAERLRKKIEASKFLLKEHEIPVTISLGIASKSESAEFLIDIISNADKALYKAKSHGRNQVVVFNPSEAESEQEPEHESEKAPEPKSAKEPYTEKDIAAQ